MNPISSQPGHTRHGVRLAMLGVLLSPLPALAEGDNWIELSVGGAAVDGNDAAFMRRNHNNGDFYGGISSFHFEQLGDSGILQIDGHALPGLEDYEVEIEYTRDELGFVRAGYKQFRTWYDGSGGYVPGSMLPAGWLDPISPYDDELHIDRGSLWFEAGLRKEDLPEITFGYEHQWREGLKDSTFWQRLNEAGGNSVYPGLYSIDEERDIFRLDVKHQFGNTEVGGGLRYDSVRNDDSRITRLGGGGGSTLTQQDINDYDLWSGYLYSQTRLMEDAMLLAFGYNLTTLDSDIGGFRTVNHNYNSLMGGGQSTTQVINASMWWNPVEDLVVVPSFRFEWWNQDMWGGHIEGDTPAGTRIYDQSSYDNTEATAQCEVRYTGIDNILLYGRALYTNGSGDLARFTLDDGMVDGTRFTDSDLDLQKYIIGANWYPMSGVSVATQAYYRKYDQSFNSVVTGSEDALLAGHLVETVDANIRVTWRALPCLTFVTRYDYQQTDIENEAWELPISNQSADITKHILTESVSWTPIDRLYLQGGIHWISSETDTPADQALPGVITDWDNDYVSLSFNGGYAISEDTQLNWGYYYYHADNYGYTGTPYGTISDEHMFTVGVDHRVNENVILNFRYGYMTGDDDAAGGFNDYDAHVVSTGVRVLF